MVAVKYDDLLLAFDFVGSTPPTENNAYICLDSGEIFWTSELNSLEEEVPDDLETSDRYLAVPHKNDLNLGRNLALRFVMQALPERREQVAEIFRRKGAYARFKQLLASEGVLEKWYEFESQSVDTVLREWCTQNGIQIREKGDEPTVR